MKLITKYAPADLCFALELTKEEFKQKLEKALKNNIEEDLILFYKFTARIYPRGSERYIKILPLLRIIELKLEGLNTLKKLKIL